MAHYDPGTYEVEVQEHGFGESEVKKTPFIWLSFVPLSKNGIPVDVKYTRDCRMYITDNTVGMIRDRLARMGWSGANWTELDNHSFSGTRVMLQCEHDNRDRDHVWERWDFPYEGEPKAATIESDPTVTRKLDAMFGRALRGQPAAAGAGGGGDNPF